jgi:hypothetical protein
MLIALGSWQAQLEAGSAWSGLAILQEDDAGVDDEPDKETNAVKKLEEELEQAKAALKASKKALAKYATAEAKAAAAEEAAEQLKQDIAQLLKNKKSAEEQWRKDLSSAKTNAEKSKLFRNRPGPKYGEEFLALYQDNEGVDGARKALRQSLLAGDRRAKQKSADLMLKIVDELEPKERESSYVLLAQFGSGESREKALEALLELAKKAEKDNSASAVGSEALLTQVAGAPGREGAEIRQEAVAMIWENVKADVRSVRAAKLLALVGEKGKSDIAIPAYEALFENHGDSDELNRLLDNPSRMPSAATEFLLKTAMEHGSGQQQVKAALAFAKYIETRDRYKGFYSGATEDQIKTIGQDVYEYLTADSDPNELESVEGLLDSYVESSSSLLDKANDQLFMIRNLSPGATVMEIEGVDLDGTEFKLSDYRGKVVFLDFWGDW